MKKILSLSIVVLFGILPVFAHSNETQEFINSIRQSYVTVLPFYQRLEQCAKYELNYGGTYRIYGLNGNSCHFSVGSLDCNMPMNVTKQYSAKTIQDYKKKITDLNRGYFNASSGDAESRYQDDMMHTYCKMRVQTPKGVTFH